VKDCFRLLIAAPSINGWWHGKKVLAPPRALPLLAGLTPSDVDVELVDENVRRVDTTKHYDGVALSVMTPSAHRAYALADHFRANEIPVILGGIHPTVMPDEAAQHADAIGIGEAEPYWEEMIRDMQAGHLKPRYQAPAHRRLDGLPRPRFELLDASGYLTTNVVETTRGCPYGCAPCSVSLIAGREYRHRPVEEIVEEVRSLPPGWIGFVSDNFAAAPGRTKQLCEALIPLGKKWLCQADVRISEDLELMDLMYRSGCHGVFAGIESIDPANLLAINKTPCNQVEPGHAIEVIQKVGKIPVIGSFIFGLENDDPTIFIRTLRFAKKHGLAAAQFSALTPYPGTALFDQMVKAGRMLTYDWSRFTFADVVFRPNGMTPEQLYAGRQWTYGHFYSWPSIINRCRKLPEHRILAMLANRSYRSIGKEGGLAGGLPGS